MARLRRKSKSAKLLDFSRTLDLLEEFKTIQARGEAI
jgi:hypothetical protein